MLEAAMLDHNSFKGVLNPNFLNLITNIEKFWLYDVDPFWFHFLTYFC